jgi:hypothetical protein
MLENVKEALRNNKRELPGDFVHSILECDRRRMAAGQNFLSIGCQSSSPGSLPMSLHGVCIRDLGAHLVVHPQLSRNADVAPGLKEDDDVRPAELEVGQLFSLA